MKQFLKQVTVTGADDSVPPESLVGIQRAYPYVEFGILCSKNNVGMQRFPSQAWIEKLRGIKAYPMKLPMHLCGSWVRSVCAGDGLIFKDWISAYFDMFDRIQLNFHGNLHYTYNTRFMNLLKSFNIPIIFQMDGVNNRLYFQSKDWGVDCYALYDISGGAGILPEYYPKPIGQYCGYAGGLSPDNLKEQLENLSHIIGQTPIWVDAETHLRSHDDKVFDMDKVIRFLEIAKPYVIGSE
jgi:hypothetical protein